MPARLSKWSFPAGDPPGSAPLPRVYPPLSKFQWRPACFVPNPGVGPTAGFPHHKTAFKWPLGAPVGQNCLSKASRSTDPSSTAPKVCFGPCGPPHTQTLNGSSLLSCDRPQRLPTPPWSLAGCLTSPFLPPWCLPGASQAVQLVLSCLPNASWCLPGCPIDPFLPPWRLRLSNWSFPASLALPGVSQAV